MTTTEAAARRQQAERTLVERYITSYLGDDARELVQLLHGHFGPERAKATMRIIDEGFRGKVRNIGRVDEYTEMQSTAEYLVKNSRLQMLKELIAAGPPGALKARAPTPAAWLARLCSHTVHYDQRTRVGDDHVQDNLFTIASRWPGPDCSQTLEIALAVYPERLKHPGAKAILAGSTTTIISSLKTAHFAQAKQRTQQSAPALAPTLAPLWKL